MSPYKKGTAIAQWMKINQKFEFHNPTTAPFFLSKSISIFPLRVEIGIQM